MRAFALLLIHTCHMHGAHAMGGMAAFIPNRRDPVVTELALAKIREDKVREFSDGCDGSWVAHPDLVPMVREIAEAALGGRPNQKDRLRNDVKVTDAEITAVGVPGGKITEAGLRLNISIPLQYINSWLQGNGAVALNNLMEDVATAEISRSQIWQWIRSPKGVLDDGRKVSADLVRALIPEELAKVKVDVGPDSPTYDRAAQIFEKMSTQEAFAEFLTLPLYEEIA
jgi:malate synthase